MWDFHDNFSHLIGRLCIHKDIASAAIDSQYQNNNSADDKAQRMHHLQLCLEINFPHSVWTCYAITFNCKNQKQQPTLKHLHSWVI